MSRPARSTDELLLGEWACLGVLAAGPTHGFAIASRLRPDADLGRIWSLSRPLTYRAIEQLLKNGYAEPVTEEPGIAGGNRTVIGITDRGRQALHAWLRRPVRHLRDLRSELLLKLHLAESLGLDVAELIDSQHEVVIAAAHNLSDRVATESSDIVTRWRLENAEAARRFLESLAR